MSALQPHKSSLLSSQYLGKEVIITISVSLFASLILRSFIAESRYIVSSSMEPTIYTGSHMIIDKISYRFSSPNRGDIIVFYPTDKIKSENYSYPFVKRIIGLPGEKIEVKNGQVYVNGLLLKENYIKVKPNYSWQSGTIPADSYLVLGDNRNNSYDSHNWGFVPRNKIIGRALLRFWPIHQIERFRRPIYFFRSIHHHRSGTKFKI